MGSSAPPGPPALLCDAAWYGTLAAARDLGPRGVPVVLASDALVVPARWSRHVSRTVRCPSRAEPARLLEWLLAFGEREPGHVLYPTSDDLAWIVAAHREELAPRFRLYGPPAEGLARLLDKAQLAVEARAVGIDVPETRCPRDEGEVGRVAREMRFPVLLKPRAQMMLSHRGRSRKGDRVERPEELLSRWKEMRRELAYHPMVADRIPGLGLPIVQEVHPARERIHTVDGFVGEGGEVFAALACNKILQHPRRSGPGVCFEEAPLAPAVAGALRRLLRATGFSGVFDAEFLVQGDRLLLIDVNPRFYNHMAFEVDRGLPLPWLAYLAALGDREAVRAAAAAASALRPVRRAYVHRLPTALLLAVQSLTGGLDPPARKAIRGWIAAHRGSITDPAAAEGDRAPALAEIAMNLLTFLRHPRAYARDLAAGGGPPGGGEWPSEGPGDMRSAAGEGGRG
jgi:predicted ATP-grasp superfamily ATP-dependent carboligase